MCEFPAIYLPLVLQIDHTRLKMVNVCLCRANCPENPKIRLPRQLRTKVIRMVGEKVNLVIPFQVSAVLTRPSILSYLS